MFLLAPFVGAPPVRQWQTLSRLADQAPVPAKLLRTQREAIQGRPVLPGDTVMVAITSGGTTKELWGTLDGWARGPLPRVGETIDVRLDPDNSDAWAVVHQVPPLLSALVPGLAVAVVAVAPLLVALVRRAGVIRVWRNGTVRTATVLSRQTTALAPGAWAARCAWANDSDRAIFRVFIPKRLPEAAEIDVLTPPRGGRRIALAWFGQAADMELAPRGPAPTSLATRRAADVATPSTPSPAATGKQR